MVHQTFTENDFSHFFVKRDAYIFMKNILFLTCTPTLMAFTGVTRLQQEVNRSKARIKPTLLKTSGVDVGAISCFICAPHGDLV